MRSLLRARRFAAISIARRGRNRSSVRNVNRCLIERRQRASRSRGEVSVKSAVGEAAQFLVARLPGPSPRWRAVERRLFSSVWDSQSPAHLHRAQPPALPARSRRTSIDHGASTRAVDGELFSATECDGCSHSKLDERKAAPNHHSTLPARLEEV